MSTAVQYQTILNNISGPMPSDLFEEFVDDYGTELDLLDATALGNLNTKSTIIASLSQTPITTLNTNHTLFNKRYVCHRCTLSTNVDEYIVFAQPGSVTKIYTVINKAIDTADETITFKNAAGESMGAITIAYDGSAAGDIDSLTPASNNTFTLGTAMKIEIGGESGQAPQCDIMIEYTITI